MPKYYISADLEGVCGVTSLLQCYPRADHTEYDAAVEQLAMEINIVATTLLEADAAAEIVVNDAHSTMTNLLADHLLAPVSLVSGKPKLCAMMAGLDSSFDAAFLVGYHAKAGTEKGVLNHTFHSKLFDVNVNGTSYGEGGINSLYASLVHQVPVILASGDNAFCAEIKAHVPSVLTVETKQGLSTTAARSLSEAALQGIYQNQTHAVLEALSKKGKKPFLVDLEPPYRLEITFINSLACDVVMTSPLYQRVDGRTVQMTAGDFETLYRGLQSAYTMLSYTDYME